MSFSSARVDTNNSNRSPGSPKHYDKYTYAVKRKPEGETDSPKGSMHKKPVGPADGPAALMLNRDGFAVAEDGSLMSRVVSPPRYLFYNPRGVAAASTSPSSGAASSKDPWQLLVERAAGEMSEDELTFLEWETVLGLLHHYKIDSPVDVARAQLVWKKKARGVLNPNPEEVVVDSALLRAAPASLPLQPIQSIAYGRPESPRREGKRVVPAHKQPLKWEAQPRIDTGLNRKRSAGALKQ